MKLHSVLFLIFSLTINAFGQNLLDKDEYNVISISGANLRKKPNLNSEILAKLPYGSKIKITQEKLLLKDTIGSYTSYSEKEKFTIPIIGNWVQVLFKEKKGYLFDSYINKTPTIKDYYITQEELSDINTNYKILFPGSNCFNNFWPPTNTNWYGIYKTNEKSSFELKKIVINYHMGWIDPKQPNEIGIIEDFIISTNNSKNLLFIIGSKLKLNEGKTEGEWRNGSKNIEAKIDENHVTTLTLKDNGKTQILNPNNKERIYFTNIFWEGDVDNDGIKDYIISFGEKQMYIFLYLSSESDDNDIVKPVAIYCSGFCC